MATKGSERIKWVADTRRQQRKEDGTDIGEGGRKEIFFFFLSFFRDSRSRFSCQIVFLAPFFSFLASRRSDYIGQGNTRHCLYSKQEKRPKRRTQSISQLSSPFRFRDIEKCFLSSSSSCCCTFHSRIRSARLALTCEAKEWNKVSFCAQLAGWNRAKLYKLGTK